LGLVGSNPPLKNAVETKSNAPVTAVQKKSPVAVVVAREIIPILNVVVSPYLG
jgi:hypothetical protein